MVAIVMCALHCVKWPITMRMCIHTYITSHSHTHTHTTHTHTHTHTHSYSHTLAHVVPPLEYKAALELEMWKVAEEEAFQVWESVLGVWECVLWGWECVPDAAKVFNNGRTVSTRYC